MREQILRQSISLQGVGSVFTIVCRTKWGETALHWANESNPNDVSHLITNQPMFALHNAVQGGKPEASEALLLLLRLGADINSQ
jgi:hypothetical protein